MQGLKFNGHQVMFIRVLNRPKKKKKHVKGALIPYVFKT